MTRTLITALPLLLAGCVGLPLGYGGVGGSGGGSSTSLMCEDLGASADAQRIEAFLATADRFHRETHALAGDLEATCASMAYDLGMDAPVARGNQLQVEATCSAVAREIDAIVADAMPRDATLEVTAEPAECTFDLDFMASCVAECDAELSARSEVYCEESVVGRSCWNDAEARADARCEAACEAEVDLYLECTEPSVTVVATATVDPDAQARMEALVATIEAHYPRFAALEARVSAVAESGAELADTFEGAADATTRLGLNAVTCFAGATAATAEAMATVQVTVTVSVEVSASVNAG